MLAGGDDARAAAHLLSSYLEWHSRDPLSRAAQAPSAAVAVLAARRRRSRSRPACRRRGRARAATAAPHDRRAPPPPPKPFRIVFPEGFTRAQMGVRVKAVAKIAEHKRHRRVRLAQPAYLAASRARRRPVLRPRAAHEPRGLPLPGDLRLPARHDLAAARPRPDRGVLHELGEGRPALRALEEPDALRRADHRLDDREGGRRAARSGRCGGGDLQPPARRGCRSGSTRRSATGWTSRRRSRSASRSSRAPARTTRGRILGLPPTPIANPGLASIRAAAHPAKVDYLYFARKPDKVHHFFTASGDGVRPVPRAARVRLQ